MWDSSGHVIAPRMLAVLPALTTWDIGDLVEVSSASEVASGAYIASLRSPILLSSSSMIVVARLTTTLAPAPLKFAPSRGSDYS